MLDKSKSLNDAALENVVGGNGDQTIKCDGCGNEFSTRALKSYGKKKYCLACYANLVPDSFNENGNSVDASGKKNDSNPDTILSNKFMVNLKGIET